MIPVKIVILVTFCLLFTGAANGQSDSLRYSSFEQVDSLKRSDPKHVVIFFHTDWCKFCELMNQTTLEDSTIIKLLNDHFYFVSFNAESEASVKFAGHDFKYVPKGNKTGIHEIATELGTVDGKVNYPTLCILNQKYEIIFQYNEYISAEDLSRLLNAIIASPE